MPRDAALAAPGALSVTGPAAVMRSGGEVREAQLERLLREFGPAVARLCAAYERDPAERDDLWQDIAFSLWKALETFRGECSEKTFVYRVARNRALTHRFRRRRATAPISEAPTWPTRRRTRALPPKRRRSAIGFCGTCDSSRRRCAARWCCGSKGSTTARSPTCWVSRRTTSPYA